ncbi:hypothetical protein D3C80_723880 [compost metagenome]
MGKFHRAVDITGLNALNPLGNMIVQRTGPLADGMLAAFQAAICFTMCLLGTKWQINLVKVSGSLSRREFVRLTARRQRLHLTDFALPRLSWHGCAVPRLCFLAGGTLTPHFGQLIQPVFRDQRQRIGGAILDARRALRSVMTQIAFIR